MKICVVGTGRWGKNHVKTLHSLGVLGGVVDNQPDVLSALVESYPGINTYATIQESLNGDFDGYTVATPAETHYDIASYLLDKNKPVLVEKPLSLNSTDAKRLHELAQKNQIPLMVGHLMLFHPAIQQIKTLIENGQFGKLEYLYSNRLNLGTVRKEENILWSFAPHDVSIFQYFIEKKPVEVISRGGAFLQPSIDDTTMTILTYPENIVGHIFVSWLHPFKEHRIVIVGSKGMITFEDSLESKPLLYYEKGIDWVQGEPIKRDGPTEFIEYEKEMPLTNELKYFLHQIKENNVQIADGLNGVEVLEILEEASMGLMSKTKNSDNNNLPYFVHPTSIVDDPSSIGEGTKIWHYSHVQSGSTIGKNCSLGQNVNIGNNVIIGDSVKIQNNVTVYEGVILEDFVFCGPSMVFTNIQRPRSEFPQRGSDYYQKTLVKKSVSIGANATIVCGTTIGEYAFIGAGTVVTKDVPAHGMMIGNPGRVIGWVDKKGNKIEFDENGNSLCGSYRLSEDKNSIISLK